MNFSSVDPSTLLGKAIRLPLRLIPTSAVLPILQGRLKGMKWIAGSSINGCWLGSYEFDLQNLFIQTITPSSVVFDIGAHAGFYSLLASVLTGKEGHVLAFEPFPRNINYLNKHIQLNRLNNVKVFEMALDNYQGIGKFDTKEHSSMGRLSNAGSMDVIVRSLDDLFDKEVIPLPDFIKMDIEGGELRALTGAKKLLLKAHPIIFLATHGDDIKHNCCQFLLDLGYRLQPIGCPTLEMARELLAQ